MFLHILVPLDGSKLAETALPAAKFLAGALGARVTLVHVVEEDAPPTIHGERHLRSREEAEAYLDGISALAGSPESVVDCHVHAAGKDNVVRSIVAHQAELAPDLIVMCTHGRGGLKRIIIGSIAQQVVASGHTPVLLIRPDGYGHDSSFSIKTLLVPVDGEQAHEQGLEVALELARAIGARLQLLSVMPTMGTLAGRDATMGRFMPGTTQAMLELAETDLKSYLVQQVTRLQRAGVPTSAELHHGDTAPMIAEVAETLDAGMVVLATHGKAGNEAFWTNSVAARVQAQTKRPLLLVPVKETQESSL
ncbi:MAG: universal stress protein [Acidobacteriota bacterium]|jgi:nucleotide-binding universal stress UspA family protein